MRMANDPAGSQTDRTMDHAAITPRMSGALVEVLPDLGGGWAQVRLGSSCNRECIGSTLASSLLVEAQLQGLDEVTSLAEVGGGNLLVNRLQIPVNSGVRSSNLRSIVVLS
jgi:hypothetical protein